MRNCRHCNPCFDCRGAGMRGQINTRCSTCKGSGIAPPRTVTQEDRALAALCLPPAVIFAETADHLADLQRRAEQHIARAWADRMERHEASRLDEDHQGHGADRGVGDHGSVAAGLTGETVPGEEVASDTRDGDLRGALERIAASRYGLQNISEDYGHDTNAYNYHAMRYYAGVSRELQNIARETLAASPKQAPVDQGEVA